MSRLTIDVDDDLLNGLKRRAAYTGRTLSSLVEEALRQKRAALSAEAKAVIAKARQSAELDEDEAMRIAVEETRKVRQSWPSKSS